MKKTYCILVPMALLFLAGCVPSLHGLYTDKDTIYDPALVGVWSEPNSSETWEFAQSGDKTYRLTITEDKGKTGRFQVHLVNLEGKMFLDLFPEDPNLPGNTDYYKYHLLPIHTFIRVEQITPALKMAAMNPEGLKNLLKENPQAVRHEVRDDQIILTASTPELQKFLLKNLDQPKFFGDFCTMTCQKPQPPAPQPNPANPPK